MRPHLFRITILTLGALLVLGSLAGCATFHSWAQLGSNHPAAAGASVTIPLGK
jgi:hypothetical protein